MLIKIYYNLVRKMAGLQDLSLLFMRLILAYGFFEPAKMKLTNLESITQWFESLGYPAPGLSALLAAITESAGVLMLFLGIGTRVIAIPLMFTMVVAITTVHWENGFSAGDNGFEIPLYYLIMLFGLMAYGSGKYSLDHIIRSKS